LIAHRQNGNSKRHTCRGKKYPDGKIDAIGKTLQPIVHHKIGNRISKASPTTLIKEYPFMTKNRSDGDFNIVFKHVVSPQISKGNILTPVCHRQKFIPCRVEKTSLTVKNVQYPIAGDPIPSLRCMVKRFRMKSKGKLYH